MAQMGPDGKAAALSGDARAAWLERAKKWVDLSPVLGVTRLMHNQGASPTTVKPASPRSGRNYRTTPRRRASRFPARRAAPEYDPGGGGQVGGAASSPAMSESERIRYVWGILLECTLGSGGYTNLDFGGETRFHDQQELHDAIKGLLPRNAGGMHTRVIRLGIWVRRSSTPSRLATRACTPSR